MILFVGDKPSPRMKPGAKPFEGAACEQRLKEWAMYLADFSKLDWEFKTTPWIITNASFGPGASRLAEIFIIKHFPIVALGEFASDFLFAGKYEHFKLPHPSGRNRQINDKEFIQKKLLECKKYIEEFNEK